MCKELFVFLISFLFFACNINQKAAPIRLCDIDSLTTIKKTSFEKENIKNLDGKFIEIVGFFNYTFENVSLYPSKTSSSTKAIWLNFTFDDKTLYNSLEKLKGKKVLVIGKVDTSSHGHMNMYIAELDSTSCITEIK